MKEVRDRLYKDPDSVEWKKKLLADAEFSALKDLITRVDYRKVAHALKKSGLWMFRDVSCLSPEDVGEVIITAIDGSCCGERQGFYTTLGGLLLYSAVMLTGMFDGYAASSFLLEAQAGGITVVPKDGLYDLAKELTMGTLEKRLAALAVMAGFSLEDFWKERVILLDGSLSWLVWIGEKSGEVGRLEKKLVAYDRELSFAELNRRLNSMLVKMCQEVEEQAYEECCRVASLCEENENWLLASAEDPIRQELLGLFNSSTVTSRVISKYWGRFDAYDLSIARLYMGAFELGVYKQALESAGLVIGVSKRTKRRGLVQHLQKATGVYVPAVGDILLLDQLIKYSQENSHLVLPPGRSVCFLPRKLVDTGNPGVVYFYALLPGLLLAGDSSNLKASSVMVEFTVPGLSVSGSSGDEYADDYAEIVEDSFCRFGRVGDVADWIYSLLVTLSLVRRPVGGSRGMSKYYSYPLILREVHRRCKLEKGFCRSLLDSAGIRYHTGREMLDLEV